MIRLAAFELLRLGPEAPLRRLPEVADRYDLDMRDRALLRHLVATGWRRLGTLRALSKHLLNGKPKPDLAAFLHTGLVQILFTDRIPDHAAVGETVEACVHKLGLGKGRTLNACLRRALRMRESGSCGDPRRDLIGAERYLNEDVFRDPRDHPLLWAEDALSMPAPLMKTWTKRHGSAAARGLAEWALKEPPLSVRILSGAPEEIMGELRELGLEPTLSSGSTHLFASEQTSQLLESPAFARGALMVQGASASSAAESVQAKPGEHVLDLCAAPGGKSLIMAKAGAKVTACDATQDKVNRIAENLVRCNLGSQVELVVADAGDTLERSFDAVLVDAPCSNTGVLASRPEARWRFGPANQKSLGEIQARLIRAGADRVQPGGRLIWSTCSLEPSENEAQVRSLLAERPEFELEQQTTLLPELSSARVDGGFSARLVHRGD